MCVEEIDLGLPFELAAARFATHPGTVLLLSGSGPTSGSGIGGAECSRFNILAVDPWLELKGSGPTLCLGIGDTSEKVAGDPFSFLGQLMDHMELEGSMEKDLPGKDLPIRAGLFGYLAYDLKDCIEILPRTCMETHLPDICLYAPSLILVQDLLSNKTFMCIPVLSTCDSAREDYVFSRKEAFLKQLGKPWEKQAFSIDGRGFKSSFTKQEYIRAVERIIQYLKSGDIYQANLSQRFETRFSGDAYALFLELFHRNPASFFSFIHAGNHRIISTSPERFIKLDGRKVETRPIKGTIARGKTVDQDRKNGQQLVESIKDDAELTMIVDLMRNDLSRVTEHGSVEVAEHKRLEPYANVFHLVSIVRGELEKEKTAVDLLRATFPGGSITGCPKIRSMEIIDELEPIKRHVYTGSIGYISFHGTMDLSIAIRTATLVEDALFFSVGGGIVYDSDPEREFQETLDKGKTLMETLSEVSCKKKIPHLQAWVDGKIVDQDQAMVSAQSFGFQYGAGLFETIRVEKGRPIRLAEHLQRLNRSWTLLFNRLPPDITWEHVIDLVIRENGFQDRTCALKLMVSRDEQANGKQTFLAALIRPYVHRLELIGKAGLDLVTFPNPRLTFLADHKTQNYLYYERAGQYARSHKGDEALILNPDLSVSETNTCNLFVIKGKELILPASGHVLPGVALNAAVRAFAHGGGVITRKKMSVAQLVACPNVLVINSLMGPVRVLHIDGQKILHDQGVCGEINRLLSMA
ncbi:MAG: aminodeoxychorismate synthase component I [Proteobacteria bacterium]|nr:aminodeoxychorismate synthase component I [Pseudomonadota bacterium]